MNIINLTPGFAPFGEGVSVTNAVFPSKCELNLRVPIESFQKEGFDGKVLVTIRVSSSDDIMRIMLIADALDRIREVKEKLLYLPFVPYARQDHMCAPGEAFSLKVFTRMLNSCGWDRVTVFDPHSDVAAALIDNVEVHSNSSLVKAVLSGKSNYLIASPDAGAYKKIGKLADEIGYNDIIVACGKVRDPRPENKGKILRMSVPTMDYGGKDVYIIDDIVEGGRTFAGIAQELRKQNVGKIFLIVSHPVLSQGDAEMQKFLDGIYTTDSFVSIGEFNPDFVMMGSIGEQN